MEKARSKFKIKLNIIFVFVTIFGASSFAYLGKQAHKEGKSVGQMVLDMRAEEKRKYEEEQAKKQ